MSRPRALRTGLAIALAALVAMSAVAGAEVMQRDGVRVKVTGGLSPKRLPRTGSAPIAVSVGGKISAVDEGPAPTLDTLQIDLNRNGHLDFVGLPVCDPDAIQPASTSRALSACRPALVGRGSFEAEIILGTQEPYPIKGQLVAFNGKLHGKPVLLGQIYSPRPFATSFVIVFTITKVSKGKYGTRLLAHLPASLRTWGRLTGIELKLSRTYSYRGQRHSYLSAGCPLPKGVPKAGFSLARTTFGIGGGPKLSLALTRTCTAISGR